MSFLDKFKAGMAEAGSKAKTVVEINKLKVINLSKQNDINQSYQEIGRLVYESYERAAGPLPESQLEPHLAGIRQLKWDIEQNLQKISSLSESKKCGDCGADVPFDARECPKCGFAFEVIDVTDYETDKVESADTIAEAELEAGKLELELPKHGDQNK